MTENNNEKFVEFVKSILRKIKPRFSFHYVAYTTLFFLVIFSAIQLVSATTPNPGHPWAEIGDGTFVVTGPSLSRTYTFPDANATILTTNNTVTVAQGGTGQISIAAGSVWAANSADTLSAITSATGTKILTNTAGTITWEVPSSGMIWPGSGIPNSTGSAWGTSYSTIGSGTVLVLATTPTFTTSITTPLVLGGSATTSDLNLQTTSGVGTTGADMHFLVGSNGGTEAMTILNSGNIGIGQVSPTARLHLMAGTTIAETAPLKFTSGTNLTTAEAGAMEWNGTNLFITQTSGPTRKTIAYTSDIPVASPITIVNSSNLFSTGLVGTGSGVTSTTDSNFIGSNAGYNATSASNSNFIGSNAGNGSTDATNSNFFGQGAGNGATDALDSNFLGNQAGLSALRASRSNFLGGLAGYTASDADNSNFFGYQAGYNATDAASSNFFGSGAGYSATNAFLSNFFGSGAGNAATSASNSNFIGTNAGYDAASASYSNFLGYSAGDSAVNASYSNIIGYKAGKWYSGNQIGSNNIIIGTNISLPNTTANAVNIGGILFATGTYSTTSGNPSITAVSGGKIGIGVVSPNNTLQVADLINFNDTDFNTFIGTFAGANIVSGAQYNTFLGYEAGKSAAAGGTNAADYNTAIGYRSLYSNTTGSGNIAIGTSSLTTNTTGSNNTANGYNSLSSNTTGSSNVALGYNSLYSNKTNNRSTAIGYNAMYYADNRTPTGRDTFNTALGYEALKGSTTAANNTGQYNTTIGDSSLSANTSGEKNAVIGANALMNNTTGFYNVALGYNSGRYISAGTANATSSNSLYLGYDTRASADGDTNEIVIGTSTIGNGSNTATIGNTSIVRTYLTGLNLKAGTATAGTAPLKFTSGTNLTTAEAGAMEWDGTNLFITQTSGPTRKTIAYTTDITATAWDAIGDPSGNGAIAFGSTVQTMDWATATTINPLTFNAPALTTGKLLSLASNTLTSGTLLDLISNGTGALTNQKGLNIALSGTNGTPAQTTYGTYISNSHAGTTSTNVGLYATAINGTTANYAAIFDQGNVGIGTTTPGQKLDVTGFVNASSGFMLGSTYVIQAASGFSSGTAGRSKIVNGTMAGGGAFPWVISSGDQSSYLGGYIGFNTDIADAMRIIANGNVGIGTTGPSNALSVYKTTAAQGLFYGWSTVGANDANGQILIGNNASYQGIIGYSQSGNTTFTIKNSMNSTSAAMNFDMYNTHAMTILGSGNVGIGTTTPASKLDITTNSLGVTQTDSSGLALINTTTAAAGAQQISPALRFTSQGWETMDPGSLAVNFRIFSVPVQGSVIPSGYLTFKSSLGAGSYTNTMAITTGNFVGIGTTTPSERLDVSGNINTSGNINIPTTSSTVGIIKQNGTAIFHTYGTDNLFMGASSGNYTLTGQQNTSVGKQALLNLTSGSYNTAVGYQALYSANSSENAAFGRMALMYANGANYNTAVGNTALGGSSLTGSYNIGIGKDAGRTISSGGHNVFVGYSAGYNVSQLATATNSMALGDQAYTTASNQVVIGASTVTQTLLNGNIGIGTTTTTNILSLSGTAAQTIWMERNTTAATAGQGLTLSSGGAISGTADLAGGDLNLKSGISTGTGSSAMRFFTATAGTAGAADRTPTEKMTILGSGNVGIGDTTPDGTLDIDSSVTTGVNLGITNTGVYTGTGLLSIIADSATTGVVGLMTANGLSSGSILSLTSVGTAALTNQKGLNIDLSGTNGTSAQTTYGAYISNSHAGTTSTNVGLYATASGGTTANYSAIFVGNMQITGNILPSADDTYTLGSDSYRFSDLFLGPQTLHIGTSTSDEGYISYTTSTNVLKIESIGDLVLQQYDGGKVGIGTSTPSTILDLGSFDNGTLAGPVITLGINNNATTPAAGSVNLKNNVDVDGYVWQDASGYLRIFNRQPTAARDTDGTVIGDQTSIRETKQDINDYTDYDMAFSMVINAPLHTFRYKKEVSGYGFDSPLAKERIGFIADEVDQMFMWGNSIDQVSVNGLLMASIKAMDLKIVNIDDLEIENSWRDSLMAWLANAENHIARIFTGEICLTEPGQEAVCINRTELQSLKALLIQTGGVSQESSNGGIETEPEATCSDGILNQDEMEIDIGGICNQNSTIVPELVEPIVTTTNLEPESTPEIIQNPETATN